jgi:hypothetical protein
MYARKSVNFAPYVGGHSLASISATIPLEAVKQTYITLPPARID